MDSLKNWFYEAGFMKRSRAFVGLPVAALLALAVSRRALRSVPFALVSLLA
jgi:polyisoprenoid-binding protein YceI